METAALREEILATQTVIKGLRDSHQALEWACWFQSRCLEASLLVDLVALVFFIWYCRCRREPERLVSDTGGSSSDGDESSSGYPLALKDRPEGTGAQKGGRKGPSSLQGWKGNMETTLDIPEVQILVHYPGDANALNWHHRILLRRIQAGTWFTLTLD